MSATEHVFMSYSKADGDYVARLHNFVESRGVKIWRDDSIGYGAEWAAAIEKELERSRAVILIMSENSVGSRWVKNEIFRAQSLDIPVYALLLSGSCWLAGAHFVTSRVDAARSGSSSDLPCI